MYRECAHIKVLNWLNLRTIIENMRSNYGLFFAERALSRENTNVKPCQIFREGKYIFKKLPHEKLDRKKLCRMPDVYVRESN
ncbi:unnamed protein product [Cuscuta epithymum]|uniref:Uncharacterized protein n=1 Tax=Cuscuta epithymum TaxID=186058 RepID=A0AAV0E6Z8_9ASTE|nr:unnamed protein product [Cuscuta epithymum]